VIGFDVAQISASRNRVARFFDERRADHTDLDQEGAEQDVRAWHPASAGGLGLSF